MNFINLLKNDFYRAFSVVFCIATLFVMFIMLLTTYPELALFSEYVDILHLFATSGSRGFSELFLVASIIPSISLYSQDLKSKNILYTITRIEKRYYILSKIIVSFISGFMVVFTAYYLYMIICSMFMPLITEESTYILENSTINAPLEYISVYILNRAFGAGFFSVVCLVISNIANNIFVLAISPYIIVRLFNELAVVVGIPFNMSISHLIFSDSLGFDYLGRITYTATYFILLSLIFSVIFLLQTRKKEV